MGSAHQAGAADVAIRSLVGIVAMVLLSCSIANEKDAAGGAGSTGGSGGMGSGAGGMGSGSGGAGGAPACPTALAAPCGACMGEACCEALSACEADAACWACVTGADGTACESSPETHERVDHFLTCKGGQCPDECVGGTSDTCEGKLDEVFKEACVTCLEGACCSEVAACAGQPVCWDGCLTNHDPDVCHGDPDGHALFHALSACVSQKCAADCVPPPVKPACDAPAAAPSMGACIAIQGAVKCNPITNEGCGAEGSACDLASSGEGFVCYGPPNEQALCAPCGGEAGWCAPGHVCVTGGQCARYCCDDGDCGTGTCDKSVLGVEAVGVCVAP